MFQVYRSTFPPQIRRSSSRIRPYSSSGALARQERNHPDPSPWSNGAQTAVLGLSFLNERTMCLNKTGRMGRGIAGEGARAL